MNSNLSQIFRIQKFLEKINYPNAYRSAREISDFLSTNNKFSENIILDRIKKGEPWEYICNHTTFCQNTFKVTKYTLIPRIESEQIVYDTQKTLRNSDIKNIIDVGTGSGCLIISLAKILESPSYSFWATDISNRALKVAKYNEKKILYKEKIHWIKTDLIKDIPKLDDRAFIIANLPYIPTEQYQKLDKSVKDYEPRNALDGGEDGLKHYSKLFTQIKQRQLVVKHLYIETGECIFNNTRELIYLFFPHSHVEEKQDCFNKKRFLFVTPPEQG